MMKLSRIGTVSRAWVSPDVIWLGKAWPPLYGKGRFFWRPFSYA